jgi:hypothetical protein
MIKLAITGAVAAVIAAAFAISAAGASSAGPSKPSAAGASAMSELGAASAGVSAASAYEPHLTPADFSPVVDNPYFPLPVGRTWVYRGTRDGQSQIDRVTVTSKTKLVAEGITARVVRDVATHHGKLLEKTADWYAQDNHGNVWYVGEDTTAYLPGGKTDKSGSWEAGVNDAEPGIIMLASPQIPEAYRQEFLKGEAEDTAWIINRGGSVSAPIGTFRHALRTLEFARIEPGVVDQKVYAPGIGIVTETALTGPNEVSNLIRMTG